VPLDNPNAPNKTPLRNPRRRILLLLIVSDIARRN
jgi:hypothetical protein